jgi:C1A family cysteine protease
MKLILLFMIVCAIALPAPKHKTYKSSKKHRHHMGLKKKKLNKERRKMRAAAIPIPDKLDLRPNLTPILDQGSCGSCWSFSLTSMLRDGYTLKGMDPGPVSQQYLVDCAETSAGCSGGYFDAADYLQLPKGSPSAEAYPYRGVTSACQKVPPVKGVVGWHMLGDADGVSTLDIESYMARSGKPVSITVAAAAGEWESYDSGIYNDCVYAGVDHMINIVGWDNEGASFDAKGNLPPGKGIWILRNSWGRRWGEEGWMRTKMTDESGKKCNNVADEAAYFDFEAPAPPPEPGSSNSWPIAIGSLLGLGLLLALRAKKRK